MDDSERLRGRLVPERPSGDLADRIQIGIHGEPLELYGIRRFQSFEPDFGFGSDPVHGGGEAAAEAVRGGKQEAERSCIGRRAG